MNAYVRIACALTITAGPALAATPIEVELLAPKFITSVRKELTKEGVLAALASASTVTAQMVWSARAVSSPGDPGIEERSAIVEVSQKAREKIVLMLSSESDYEDYGAPCFCEFQPQLRLRWSSGDGLAAFAVLVSGVSHGEIRAYKNGSEVCEVKEGAFIPVYLDILDQIFPSHEMAVSLRKFHEEVRMKNNRP